MLSKKKGYFLLATFFFILFITNFNTRFVLASDDDDNGGFDDDNDDDGVDDDNDDDSVDDDNDDDSVDDDFEEENKRDIDIEFTDDEFQIESKLRNGEITDEIQLIVKYDEDGISIEFSYKEESESNRETDSELEFNVEFRKLIEFVDLNANGVYDEFIDQYIQEIALNSFKPVSYSSSSLSSDTDLHYIRVQTADDVFTAHIYVSEEFEMVNNSLITPNQIKINIEIKNFKYLNNISHLALYTKLESEIDFEEEDETEDEREGYAKNEQGVITRVNHIAGIFTWQENATIDGVSQKVLTNPIETDDNDENEQRIFFNYPYGDHIFHDPKIGIAGLLKSDGSKGNIIPLTILIVAISIAGALSVSIAYSVYHYTHNKHPLISRHNNKDFHIKSSRHDVIDKDFDFQVFEGPDVINNLILLEDVNITALSADFIETIDKFEMEESDKNEFINEMLSLTPKERKSILNMMLKNFDQLK